ncbi:MAG: cytochrome c oxidase assembly protein [Gemmatimonadota bacterium]
MQWWCAAQGVPWEWRWRPYPGVWAFLLVVAATYTLVVRRQASRTPRSPENPPGGTERRRIVSFAVGLGALWVALDWPIGTLGAGYLVSVHMVQFLLISLAAPPLLLHGLPRELLQRLERPAPCQRLLRAVTHPVVALLTFNAVLIATHWPAAVDGLMASQAGSFLLDMAWLGAGGLFWWPIVSPVPARPGFPYPLKIGYLILNTVLVTAPFAFLTFSEWPFYRIYELAPPIAGIGTQQDQRLAGVLMKLGGGTILWTAAGVLFFRWYRAEGDPAKEPDAGSP